MNRPSGPTSGQTANDSPLTSGLEPGDEADEKALLEAHSKRFLFFNLMPSWLVSLITHVLLIVLLAVVFMEHKQNTTVSFVAADVSGDSLSGVDVNLEPLDFDAAALEMKEIPQESQSTKLDENLQLLDMQPTDIMSDLATADRNTFSGDSIGDIDLPTSGAEVNGRSGDMRGKLTRKFGGTPDSEEAVVLALKWLADHQLPDGGWNFDHSLGPGTRSRKDVGALVEARNAATAMALLPFLGAGNTHLNGEYKDTVKRGLEFLMERGKKATHGISYYESPRGRMYSHGFVSIVFCEAYAMTKDRELGEYAQGCVRFIEWFQNKDDGGWRYDPQERGDTSVVGWQVMALKSAQLSGLDVRKDTWRLVTKFLDYVSIDYGAIYGYTDPPADRNYRSLGRTAIGLLCRMYMGWSRDKKPLEDGIQWLSEAGPTLRSENNPNGVDMYYNYYATQVMKQYGNPHWDKWNNVMRDFLVKSQDTQGAEKGSWYFDSGTDYGAEAGGRLYFTAMCTMTLEVYYRYMPLYDEKTSSDPFPLD
jgi:hypothetical protein